MQWWDEVAVFGVIVTVIALLGTAWGVKLAYDQAKAAAESAKTAVDIGRETQAAVDRATRHIAANQLLLTLPALLALARDLDAAISDKDLSKARLALVSWHTEASQVRGLLKGMDWGDEQLLKKLANSTKVAAATKGALLSGSIDLVKDTESARTAIEGVCERMGELAGRLRTESGDQHDG
ncbi:MAG: hypothetical protein QOE83_1605 [Actinomycetota bacterium]|jgi:hypothetical protein|nr:hypothetical protein [Actinomycetota bacterium]